jgi:phosphonate transport system ATP-binding protein
VIQIKELSQSFPNGVRALTSASIEFRAGEFSVLLGPSGAGKSTLLRCLNLLYTPTTGHIIVDGIGMLDHPRLVRRHRLQTGMIFQQHQLIGRYSALDNVLLGRYGFHGVVRSLWPLPWHDRMLALACLEQVGLASKALQRVDCLSGGEQQRVGIARALAQQPKLILADEPVASLDPASATDVLRLLHRICKERQLTAIVSLHQVELAKQFAERIIGLAAGRVVFDGGADELTPQRLQRIYSRRGDDELDKRPVDTALHGAALP